MFIILKGLSISLLLEVCVRFCLLNLKGLQIPGIRVGILQPIMTSGCEPADKIV